MYKPRIAVIVDRIDWAFGSHFKDLCRQLPQFEWVHADSGRARAIPLGAVDMVYSLACWWEVECYPPQKCILSVRSTRQYGKSVFARYPGGLQGFLGANYGRTYALSRQIVTELAAHGITATHLPNAIDTSRFAPDGASSQGKPFTVGWAGWTQDGTRGWKRVEVIRQACAELPNVELRIADLSDSSYVPWEFMPEWYNGLDLYVCASSGGEGSNRSTLEAMACGVPVISTRVGEAEDLIQDGANGWLFDGNSKSLRHLLKGLAANRDEVAVRGMRARATVCGSRSWDMWREKYATVFMEIIDG